MIKSLQGLRLLGIITIVAGHAGLSWWGCGSWCSFFFILSGFLYKTDVRNWHDYLSYVWRKAKSIYPIYWVCLFAYIALAYIRGCEEQYRIGWDFLPHLVLMQSWVPGIDAWAYLLPAWFLSSLMFCYCFSPIVKMVVGSAVWTIVGIVVLYVLWTRVLGWESYISPVYRLLEYAFGMWLSAFVTRKEMKPELIPGLNSAGVIILLCLIRIGLPQWLEILLFGGVITMLASFSSRCTELILGNKYIVRLAKADMVIFLTHPGIAFHLIMFCFGHNAWLIVFGSVFVGYGMSLAITRLLQVCICTTVENNR